MKEPTRKGQDASICRVHDEMANVIRRFTVAIIAYYDGVPRQHATGTLVRLADHWFLVTASHAVKQYLEGQENYKDLELFLENGADNLVPLFGSYWATETVRDPERSGVSLENDLWDIAWWDLDQLTIRALTNKSFLNRTDISMLAELDSGVFYLAGFPCVWSNADLEQHSMTITALGYVAGAHPHPDELADLDPRSHVALSLMPTEAMPALTGISGCSIWKIADGPLKSDWTASSAKVVAVQTGVYTNVARGAVKGTKWSCVFTALGYHFPELRSAFDIWLPGRD